MQMVHGDQQPQLRRWLCVPLSCPCHLQSQEVAEQQARLAAAQAEVVAEAERLEQAQAALTEREAHLQLLQQGKEEAMQVGDAHVHVHACSYRTHTHTYEHTSITEFFGAADV